MPNPTPGVVTRYETPCLVCGQPTVFIIAVPTIVVDYGCSACMCPGGPTINLMVRSPRHLGVLKGITD